MTVRQNLPIMVLVEESPRGLLFRFHSILWVCITLPISVVLGIATYFAIAREEPSWVFAVVCGALSLLFLYSSIYSLKLRRSLAIDRVTQAVAYRESSLYRNLAWQKGFHDFKKIVTFRPISTAGSPGVRKARNWAIQLISNEGEIFAIGYNPCGALSRAKAEGLVTRIADIMNLEKVIADD